MQARLSQSDTWLLEVFLGLYTVIWGLWFANPLTDSFRLTTTATYTLLAHFPGGELWFGATVALLGAIKLTAAVRGSRRQRSIIAGIVGVCWAAVAVAVAIPTAWAAAGIPHFGLVALANWYVWVRLSYRGPA
jgi:hypothetical protein